MVRGSQIASAVNSDRTAGRPCEDVEGTSRTVSASTTADRFLRSVTTTFFLVAIAFLAFGILSCIHASARNYDGSR
jgi:hypothetical protein